MNFGLSSDDLVDDFFELLVKGETDKVAEMIKPSGFKVDQRGDAFNATGLHVCAAHNQAELMRMLRARGADLDATLRKGLFAKNPLFVPDSLAARATVLHAAAAADAAECAQLLLDWGADSAAKDGSGRTALELAQHLKKDQVAAVLEAGPRPDESRDTDPHIAAQEKMAAIMAKIEAEAASGASQWSDSD